MSSVTNLILCAEFEDRGISDLQAWMERNGHPVFVEVDGLVLGKRIESSVMVNAANYLDVDEFIRQFKSARWDRPECAQLFVRRQDDEVFAEIRVN